MGPPFGKGKQGNPLSKSNDRKRSSPVVRAQGVKRVRSSATNEHSTNAHEQISKRINVSVARRPTKLPGEGPRQESFAGWYMKVKEITTKRNTFYWVVWEIPGRPENVSRTPSQRSRSSKENMECGLRNIEHHIGSRTRAFPFPQSKRLHKDAMLLGTER